MHAPLREAAVDREDEREMAIDHDDRVEAAAEEANVADGASGVVESGEDHVEEVAVQGVVGLLEVVEY